MSRELVVCSALALVFVAPLLLSATRHPRPMVLLFIALVGATAFLSIQLLHRSGESARVYAYLIVLYLLLSSRMMVSGPRLATRHYVFYYSFTLVLIAVLSLSGRYVWLLKIPIATAGLFSLAVGLAFFTHAATTASLMDEELLNAVYQTDAHEAIGYLETFIGVTAVPLVCAFLVLPAVLLFRLGRRPVQMLPRARHTVLLVLVLLLTWETGSASNEYLVVSTALQYRTAMQRYRTVAAQRRAASADRRAAIQATLTRQAAETHVIVIGESTGRNHMGLYGYFRDTTPNLSRLANNLVILTDAISPDCFTQPVLVKALTAVDVEDRPAHPPASVDGLIDVLRAAGLRVYWLSNQSRLGFSDTYVTLLSEAADRRVFLPASLSDRATSRPDEALFPLVTKALDESRESTVIFVHLMGTHFPFKHRYPQRFARFRSSIPVGELGESPIDPTLMTRINQYDNAVLYNDYVVSTLIEELRRRGGSRSLLYLSDHGETPRGTGEKPRGMSRGQRFNPGQVEIPMLFWFSDTFREAHAGLVDILTANRHKRFMSDHLFDTALDLIGVTVNTQSPQRSLFRREFVERTRTTLSGKVKYDEYPDPVIMARNNMAQLGVRVPRLTEKIYVRSGPSRTSLGQAIGLFAGVALDLTFDAQRGAFEMAPSAPGPRMRLQDVLEFLQSHGPSTRLLFKLGNLNSSNAAQASTALSKLEEEYRFGTRVILTVPDTGEHLRSAPGGLTTAFLTARADTVVESDVDPSHRAFVESMSRLSETDGTRANAIVVPALAKLEHHF